jgi:pseudouridine synthase
MVSVAERYRRNVSLARALSKLGYTSRSKAKDLIRQGCVSVNRKIITDPSLRCALGTDVIAIKGKRIKRKKLVYIIMNKPIGVVTTRSDELKRPTVYDVLGEVGQWVFPVGRLDKETTGLLLLTNDNQLGELLTNPDSKVPKTYLAELDKPMIPDHIRELQNGMILKGTKLMPAEVRALKDSSIEITIIEGKNRQVRRMFDALGYKILSLVRTKIGNVEVKELKPGNWRYLSKQEVLTLSRTT